MIAMNRSSPARARCRQVFGAWALLCALANSTPLSAAGQSPRADAVRRPNILFILADDLGYSDLGAFGSEIRTPNIDGLAKQGRIYTNMYATPLCAITRAELLSGTDHHLVGLGTMLPPTGKQVGAPGYEGHLTDRALSIAEVLRDSGYHTYMAGKWHLGAQAEHSPRARGFESSFALLPGGGDHFLVDAAKLSATEKTTLLYRDNDELVQPPRNFYSTDFFTDRLIADIDRNRADGKPFFAYAAYTAPHWPLQAPDEFIQRQRGRYDAGYEVIRQRRLERLKQLGIMPAQMRPAIPVSSGLHASADTRMKVLPNDPGLKTWRELDAPTKQKEARRMEIYAAMVENLDWNVGRLLDHLKARNEFDNTLIVFMSDNGAASNGATTRAAANMNNSFDNLGKRDSYVTFSPRWAEVSNAPLSLWKQTPAEGGIAVPLIVHMPGQKDARPLSRAVVAVKDLAPTFAQIAGVENPGARYQGRDVSPWTGTSLLALLDGQVPQVHADDTVFADESDFEYYIRQGDWKAVWLKPPHGSGALKLYDIRNDRGETVDRAAQQPVIAKKMADLYEQYVQRVGVAKQ